MVGMAGTGKTTLLRNVMGLYLKKGMKVLIVDDFDHPSYRDVPKITLENLPLWKGGIYRLIHPEINEEVLPALKEHLWNTFLVFEDCFKYVGNKFTKPMASLTINAKQTNVDIIFMYHCWAWVAKDLSRRCNAYIILKSLDTPESRFNKKDAPYLPLLMDAYADVMADSNQYRNKLFKTGL